MVETHIIVIILEFFD